MGIWAASYHGRPPTTSSCVLAMDRNTRPTDTLSVDLPLFRSLLPTVIPVRMARSFSPRGRKKISEPEERDGGTKLRGRPCPLFYPNSSHIHTLCLQTIPILRTACRAIESFPSC